MAVRISRDILTKKQKDIIRKDLYMQPKKTGFFKNKRYASAKDPILMWSLDKPNNEVIVPYTFGNILLGTHINSKKQYASGNFNFKGTLRSHQVPIVSEAISHLKSYGTTTLGVYPGAGKCLAPGTEVLMYNGTKKKVEDITVGDLLMGADSSPRKV